MVPQPRLLSLKSWPRRSGPPTRSLCDRAAGPTGSSRASRRWNCVTPSQGTRSTAGVFFL